jgi:NADPH:quinone reductase-like Zn-dependent oxidoreductase
VLKQDGILVSIVKPPSEQSVKKAGVRAIFMRSDHNRGDQLAQIADLVVPGQIKVNVEKMLRLDEAREAQELSQDGHAHGKIVLAVDGDQ